MEPVAKARAVHLYRALLEDIRKGRLAGGARLPSSRAGAARWGLSRNSVNAAYDLLRAEGAVTIRPGAAPVVAPLPPTKRQPAPAPVADLSPRGQVWATGGADRSRAAIMAPGQPDEGLFPADEWGRYLRRAGRQRWGGAFGYEDYSGLAQLRQVLARRLAADRGMVATADQILITPGAQASLTLIALALANSGDRALIEDPGYIGARRAFQGAGLVLAPLPVDADGADPAGAPPARLIYLTPANQYPTGRRLTLARRAALVAHASQQSALIIEDDYDSEFLWHGRPLPALQAEAPERILTLGTAAKALMPGLRLGWIVAPPGLAAPLAEAQRNLGLAANLHAQAALAMMMDEGRYRAQLARIARTYGDRGRALAAALRSLPGVQADDPAGGVQLAIRLPKGTEAACLTALHAAGFGTAPLSAFFIGPPQEGLVSGFGDATPDRIEQFRAVLAAVLDQAKSAR